MKTKAEKQLEELESLLKHEKASQSFRDFVMHMKPDYQENWHHTLIIDRLEKLITQKNQRIMISLGPRHGKSELVSRQFSPYYLGKNPNAEIIAASYSSGLATMFSRDVQKIMESEDYSNVFPDTVMGGTERAKELENFNARSRRSRDYFEIVGGKGKFTAVGVGGAVTGKGGNLILLDDPVKNSEEADSEVYREKIWDWWRTTLYTRAEKGANILLIMTRWHIDDLAGRLLKESEQGGDKWEVIELPAINMDGPNKYDPREIGEALWPDKYPIERLEIIKKQLGERNWSSLYQSSPIIVGGNIVKESWFKYYHKLPFDISSWRSCHMIASWDLTFKETGKSFVVGVILAKQGEDYYLVDIYRGKPSFAGTVDEIKNMSKRYPKCRSILIEDKANGPAILSLLQGKVRGLTPVSPEASKDERLHSISHIIEAGNFYLPSGHPLTQTVVKEFISFPQGTHDDCVDAISQGLNKFMVLTGLERLRAATKWS